MEHVSAKLSPKQVSRLRNGHMVRLQKPKMEGEGISLIVNPANFSTITKSFSRNKGVQISLSPDELAANKSATASMAGKGIFGKKFDRKVGEIIGKPAQKAVYKIAAKELKPIAKKAIETGLTTAGVAASAYLPAAAPLIMPATAGLSKLATGYLDDPSSYQTKAGLQSAVANQARKTLIDAAVSARENEAVSGEGLYASAGRGMCGGKVMCGGSAFGVRGGLLNLEHPALRSQPFASNFQFQYTLPPQYQKFAKGSGLYA